jgi:hypothetical protein
MLRKLLLTPLMLLTDPQKFKNTPHFEFNMDGIVHFEMGFNFGR